MIGSVVILEKILGYINVEKATLMASPADFDNTAEREYRSMLSEAIELNMLNETRFIRWPNRLTRSWSSPPAKPAASPIFC
jgi:hypothetical protein